MKPHNKLITVFLTIILVACTTPKLTTSPTLEASLVPAKVTFADPVLEAMVRGSMGKTQGDISLAEAQAVTRMDLNDDLQHYISVETPIKDISGLENFTNLETLELSWNAVTDISPLQGLTKLTTLSLAGNPIADVSPLAGLTNLKLLILSGSQASDYSALAKLVNLQVLLLDDSTITDLAPLSTLINLRQLFLENTTVEDMSPLEAIYPNLEKKDFIIPSTLVDLGFQLDKNSHQAFFEGDGASFAINHAKWGPPPFEWDENIIRISMYLEGDYKLSVGYYGVHKVYVCQMDKDGKQLINYIYDPEDDSDNMPTEDRLGFEKAINAAMDVQEGEDVLFTPVRIFNETLKKTFNMTPDKLFALQYEPPTLSNLGFIADQANADYLYEQRGDKVVNLEVHNPEWGERDFDVRFFTPISEEYRIVIRYDTVEQKFGVGIDDNDQGGASFNYFVETGEFVDDWCSYPDMSVEEYFIKAYNDPAITDVYQYSVDLMVQYVRDNFGLTLDELYALPVGD
ncbi:hypothetical protein SDC9_56776 [bioreactor metagenome]|uniref:Internalin-A n=1 Tax=bioreactor metagenome TaxID=1076179 RepID=A0A644X8H4_9ZZZZ